MADARSVTGAASRRQWHMIGEIELAAVIAGHAALRSLCDRLELMADALPSQPEADDAEACRVELEQLMPRHCQREEQLLELLSGGFEEPAARSLLLNQIRSAHLLDRIHAQDLAAVLARGRERPVSPETLAYMLRCFFDGCRRAMAFEEVAFLMLAGRRLTPAARAMLLDSLGASARMS